MHSCYYSTQKKKFHQQRYTHDIISHIKKSSGRWDALLLLLCAGKKVVPVRGDALLVLLCAEKRRVPAGAMHCWYYSTQKKSSNRGSALLVLLEGKKSSGSGAQTAVFLCMEKEIVPESQSTPVLACTGKKFGGWGWGVGEVKHYHITPRREKKSSRKAKHFHITPCRGKKLQRIKALRYYFL